VANRAEESSSPKETVAINFTEIAFMWSSFYSFGQPTVSELTAG
jgi:hypothetical protein